MGAPKPASAAEWMLQQQRSQEAGDLRPRGMGPMRYGTVGPTWTFGQPWVTMSDDNSIVTAGAWPAGYSPANGDLVMVLPWKPANGQVYIEKIVLATTPSVLVTLKPTYQNGWTDYGGGWNPGGFTKASDGMVSLSGLLAPSAASNAPVFTTIFQLPVGFRPDYDLIFDTNCADTWRSLVVKATGEVQLVTNNGASSSFITLEGICFPAAGVANWQTDVTLQNGFTALTAGTGALAGLNFGPPRYWLDAGNGLAWVQGMLMHPTSVTVDNTAMLTLPASCEAENKEHHFVSETDNAWGAVGLGGGTGANRYHELYWKVGNQTTNTQLSLNRVIYPQKAYATGFNNPGLASGWIAYNAASFTTPGWKQLANSFVYAQGLLANGTVGTAGKIWNQGPGNAASTGSGTTVAGAMFNRPSNGTTRARILNDAGIPNRAWSVEQGNNGWVSFDGIMYAPRS